MVGPGWDILASFVLPRSSEYVLHRTDNDAALRKGWQRPISSAMWFKFRAKKAGEEPKGRFCNLARASIFKTCATHV
eukprot:2574176-Pyramimonas_sp.AAC.1